MDKEDYARFFFAHRDNATDDKFDDDDTVLDDDTDYTHNGEYNIDKASQLTEKDIVTTNRLFRTRIGTTQTVNNIDITINKIAETGVVEIDAKHQGKYISREIEFALSFSTNTVYLMNWNLNIKTTDPFIYTRLKGKLFEAIMEYLNLRIPSYSRRLPYITLPVSWAYSEFRNGAQDRTNIPLYDCYYATMVKFGFVPIYPERETSGVEVPRLKVRAPAMDVAAFWFCKIDVVLDKIKQMESGETATDEDMHAVVCESCNKPILNKTN